MTYNRKKQYKSTRDIKEDYYNQLVRPDGAPISSDESLLLNLVTHWTKDKPIATSTYEWILKKKFPSLNHIKSIKRKFENISLYVKCKFKQKQIVDGKVHFHKLRIERVADFDTKIAEAKQRQIEQECPQLWTQMSTAMDTNVHSSPPSIPEVTKAPEPPTKITSKNTIIDNHDNQHNQFLDSKNFNSECVETEEAKITTSEIAKNSQPPVAKEECRDTSQDKIQTVETVGKDGNTYQSPYLRDFRFTERMIDTAISRSNKPHYTSNRVWVIIRNILERKPDKTVYGGRKGAINYLVKAIDGENDFDYVRNYPQSSEEKILSMAQREEAEQAEIDRRYELLFQGKIKSISRAEEYYG